MFSLALAALLLAGCARDSGVHPARGSGLRSANDPTVSPPGTANGASNPGINQPTTTTTATRADSPLH